MDDPAPTRTAAWLGGDIEKALAEINVPAYVLDRVGVVRWTNARAVELFGRAEGRHFTELMPADARAAPRTEFAKKMFGKTQTSDYETVLVTASGANVRVQVHSVALHDGRIVDVFGVLQPEERRSARPLSAELTPRQREVLRLLTRGASTRQIAEEFGISRETVRNHIRGVLAALGVHSRLEAVVEARRRGLVD